MTLSINQPRKPKAFTLAVEQAGTAFKIVPCQPAAGLRRFLVHMSTADFTFLLRPKEKFRYNAGPYDPERQTPKYTIDVSAPTHVRRLLVIKEALIKTADGFLWIWDIENRSDSLLPPFFTVRKDGQPVRRLEHMARL